MVSFFLILIFAINCYSFDFKSKSKEIIADIVSDPAKFFYEMKADCEVTLPVPSGKKFIYNIELFPTMLPLTYINSSLNYRFKREGSISSSSPQVDFLGGFAYMLGGKIAANQNDKIEDADFWGYHLGVLFTSSYNSRIRTFYGYKYSYLKSKLNVSDEDFEIVGVKVDSFDSSFRENFLVFGVETLKDMNKYWAIQLNWGITNNTIVTKISWHGKWFELGLNIYPEGSVVIHPTWILRLGF